MITNIGKEKVSQRDQALVKPGMMQKKKTKLIQLLGFEKKKENQKKTEVSFVWN